MHPWKTSSTATIFTAISKVSWRQEKLIICTEFPLRWQNDTSVQIHFQFDEEKEVTGNQISWVEQVVTLLPFQCTVSRQWRYVPMGHSRHFPKKLFSSRDKNKKINKSLSQNLTVKDQNHHIKTSWAITAKTPKGTKCIPDVHSKCAW